MNLIRHKVLDQIRQDILSCGFRPGEELREADLANRYSVSKSPVREALQHLRIEGLVQTEPRRGHRVTPISVTDARDILEMRETLECAAIAKIVKEAETRDIVALDAFREADVLCIRAFASYNRDFHRAISAMSGNRRLSRDMNRLLDAYERLCLVSLNRLHADQGSFGQALADHCDLIDALQARDLARAKRLSLRHVRRSRTNIMKGLETRPIVE